jgi:predicted dehydrogenase
MIRASSPTLLQQHRSTSPRPAGETAQFEAAFSAHGLAGFASEAAAPDLIHRGGMRLGDGPRHALMTVRVAAIGLGWVAQNRHLPVMDRSGGYEVVGVVDRSPGRAADIARRRGYARYAQASRLADVAWIDEVDAVTVSTAPTSHYHLIREALALGKHVLTEKPFTITPSEGRELAETAYSANRRLAVVHNFQFARSIRRLAADLESGALGRITGMDAVQFGNPGRRLPSWYNELPMGLFYDESPHLIYLLRRLAGPISVSRSFVVPNRNGFSTPARIEAWFSGNVDYPVRLSCQFETAVSEWHLMVSGEKRLAIVDIFRDIYLSLPNDGAHDTVKVLRTSIIATFQHWSQHATSGIPHLTGRLSYGNDEVFDRFRRGVTGDLHALDPISSQAALDILELQHAIINRAEMLY